MEKKGQANSAQSLSRSGERRRLWPAAAAAMAVVMMKKIDR